MLDDIIAARGRKPLSYGQRVGQIVQRVSRLVAIPALGLMLGGLVIYGLSGGLTAEFDQVDLIARSRALSPAALVTRRLFSGLGMMSAGLLALALVPLINVLLILTDTVRNRRWQEAIIALAVAGILILSIFLGQE